MEKFIKANLLHIITMVATIVGASYLSIYRLDALEAKEAKSHDEVQEMKESLGAVQLDVALLCSEAVRARGGDPLRECRTSGRSR